MEPKDSHNVNEEEFDSDDKDDMADIKSRKKTRKFPPKTSKTKEKSCRPITDLNRDGSNDDSNVKGVKSS